MRGPATTRHARIVARAIFPRYRLKNSSRSAYKKGSRQFSARESSIRASNARPELRCRVSIVRGARLKCYRAACSFVLVASAVLAASPATAQTPAPDPERRYPLPTYDENWQFLSDPNRHTDPWDIVKYLQLADGMFASFGGEARESYERFGNQDFALSVPSPNGYLLQRYLLHADIHVGSRLRLWTEFNSSFENGRVRGLWSSRSFNDLR